MALTGFQFVTDTTPGAPVLSGTNGAGNAWLNWLLVTIGGWTRPFHDAATNQSVFQMPGGSQRYLYAAHASAISGLANLMTVRGSEGATGFAYSDLVDPFPTQAQIADTSSNWLISTSASAAARSYKAIVWESGVVVWIDCTGSNSWLLFAYCDPYVVYPSDTWATMLLQRNTTTNSANSTATPTTSTLSVTASYVIFCRSIDGLQKSSRGQLFGYGANLGQITNAPSMTSGYLSQPRHIPLWASCGGSTTTTPTANAILQRAALPNVRSPVHNGYGSLTEADFFTDSAYAPGCVLRPLRHTAIGAPVSLIQETNDWLPT